MLNYLLEGCGWTKVGCSVHFQAVIFLCYALSVGQEPPCCIIVLEIILRRTISVFGFIVRTEED